MLGFKKFNCAVFNNQTKTASVKPILSFFGLLLNPKYILSKYDIILFSGKESLRDAHFAVKLFNIKKNKLTINDLTHNERELKNVTLLLSESNSIVSKAIEKAQSSSLKIPLTL
jgi:hypothetical protein